MISSRSFASLSGIPSLCIAIVLFTTPASAAELLEIKPGKWETVTTITSNMIGTQTKTDSECLKENHFDPNKMMEGMPAEQCDMKTNVDGSMLTFEMDCSIEGGKMKGSGQVLIEDSVRAEGSMTVEGNMAGMALEMKVQSRGRWVEDC